MAFMLRFLIDDPTSAAAPARWGSRERSPKGPGEVEDADRGPDDLDEEDEARLSDVRGTASVGAYHCACPPSDMGMREWLGPGAALELEFGAATTLREEVETA